MLGKLFHWFMSSICLALGTAAFFCFLFLIVDCLISPLVFLFTGELKSVISAGITRIVFIASQIIESNLPLQLNTGLKGFDLMVNTYWEWQQDFYGRLKVIILGLLAFTYFLFNRREVDLSSDTLQGGALIFGLPLAWPIAVFSWLWFVTLMSDDQLFG